MATTRVLAGVGASVTWLALAGLAAPERVHAAGTKAGKKQALKSEPADPAKKVEPACDGDVTLVGADPNGLLKLDAYGGRLNARLRFEAPVKSGASSTGDRVARLTLRSGSAGHRVAIVNQEGSDEGQESQVQELRVAPGSYSTIDLSGYDFALGSLEVVYLTVAVSGCRSHSFILQVRASPLALGLRETELAPPPVAVGPGKEGTVTACLPIDVEAKSLTPSMIHVSESPVAKPAEGEEQIPFESMVVRPATDSDHSCRDWTHSLWLSVGPVAPGKYAATLKINGEEVALHGTVRNDFWLVILTVMAGFVLVVVLRRVSAVRIQQAQNERKISQVEEEGQRFLRSSPYRFGWDELSFRNQIRRARAYNRWLSLQDVDQALKPLQDPNERPNRKAQTLAIFDAVFRETLPAQLKRGVERDIARLKGIVDTEGAYLIDNLLKELEDDAKAGFRGRLGGWVGELQKKAEPLLAEIDAGLTAPASWLKTDPQKRAEVRAAIYSLRQLLREAGYLIANTSPDKPLLFERTHIDLLGRVVPSLVQIQRFVNQEPGAPVPNLVAMAHGDVDQMPDLDLDPPRDLVQGPAGGNEQARIVLPAVLRSASEVTFSVVAATPSGRYFWSIRPRSRFLRFRGPEPDVIEASSAILTYVFGAEGTYEMTVTDTPPPSNPRWQLGRTFTVGAAETSTGKTERSSAVVQFGAGAVAIVIFSLVAVAIFWAGKGFGSWRDYLTVFTTGMGVNVGLAKASPILDGLIERLGGGKTSGEAT